MMREVAVRLPPESILRYYVFSFASNLGSDYVELLKENNYLTIISKGNDIVRTLADSYLEVAEKTGMDSRLPLSGNEKPTIERLSKKISAGGTTPKDLFSAYSSYIKRITEAELFNSLKDPSGDLCSPSLMRLEFYHFTRGPFFDGKKESAEAWTYTELNIHYMLIVLAGFCISKIDRTRIESGGKPEWVDALVLPLEPWRETRSSFYRFREGLAGTSIPGFKPEEALVMWLSLSFVDMDPKEVLCLGVKGAGGMKPSEASISTIVPVQSYMIRAKDFFDKLRGNEGKIRLFGSLLRTALSREGAKKRISERARDLAGEYSKLIFLASQGSQSAKTELMLRASRIAVKENIEEKDKDIVDISKKALLISRNIV